MKIAVYANDESWKELTGSNPAAEWIRIKDASALVLKHDADAYFDLGNESNGSSFNGKPFFINSVVHTLKEMNALPGTIRINGWNGFLERPAWEVAGEINDSAKSVFSFLQKKIITVADEPGLISARIISMVINEAFYAEGENVSTKNEIDIAMKLGTNYPFGPFEWAEKIGIENIYALLKKLSATDSRYTIAPALLKKING